MSQQVRNKWSGARMSIEINCEQCQKRYRVKAELAGKRVRCMHCGNPVSVPGGQGHPGEIPPSVTDSELQPDNPGVAKRPAPPRAVPPPVPKQVVRLDPRFDPNSLSDFPTPPPPAPPQAAPKKNPQPAGKKVESQPAREIH